MCSEVAYQIYGTASSPKLDMDRYHVETAKCSQDLVRGLISVPELLGAMIGFGSWQAGLVGWGFIIIPLALLWIVCWGLGRVVYWVGAGFRRRRPSTHPAIR